MPEQLIFVLVLIAFSIGKWVLDNVSNASRGEKPEDRDEFGNPRTPTGSRQTRDSRSGGDPADEEAERLRRFMEALGLPPGETPPPPRRRKPVEPPAAARQEPAPARPIIAPARPPVTSAPKAPASDAPTTPAPRPYAPRPPAPSPFARQEPAPAASREAEPFTPPPLLAAARELAARPRPEPTDRPETPRPYQVREHHHGNSHTGLRKALRQRSSVRQALVLRELLGPPKALSGE